MIRYLLLLIAGLHMQCSVDRTQHPIQSTEQDTLTLYRQLAAPSQLIIGTDPEPGIPLELCLQWINKANQQPLPHQKVLLYHTDTSGDYALTNPADESSARLQATGVTDSLGRLYVKTILPGNYASRRDNRHIHTLVYGAHPEAYDIHFKQYTGRMGRNFIDGSDQHFLADLRTLSDSSLACFLTIEVKRPAQP